jgi:hypothetical protein
MRSARQTLFLLFPLLFLASSGLCFTDVTTLELKGFKLGMSLEQAVKNLQTRAYRENTDIRVFNGGEYAISAYFKSDIPLHLVSAKESDYTEMTMQFANNELLLFDLKTRYVTGGQAKALPDKHTRLFGPFDSRGEAVFSDTAVLFWTWGGETNRPDTPPMAPHIQVQMTSSRENGKETPTGETVRMADAPKLLGVQYAETLEQYVKGNALYDAKVKEGRKLAAQHIPKIQVAIDGDDRYKQIKVNPFEGAILVSGIVRQGDLNPLKEMVAATAPPLEITWNVREYPAEYFKQK